MTVAPRSKYAFALISILLTPVLSGFAQTEKGRLTIGGAFTGGYERRTNETTYFVENGTIQPSTSNEKAWSSSASLLLGKFFADGLEAGINPGFNIQRYKAESTGMGITAQETSQLTFFIGPHITYYIGAAEKGRPFAGLSTNFGLTRYSTNGTSSIPGSFVQDFETQNTTKSFDLTGRLGYAHFLNDSFILSFYTGYSYTTYSGDGDSSSNGFKSASSSKNTFNNLFLGASISTTFKR
jgi:hypothetical protein